MFKSNNSFLIILFSVLTSQFFIFPLSGFLFLPLSEFSDSNYLLNSNQPIESVPNSFKSSSDLNASMGISKNFQNISSDIVTNVSPGFLNQKNPVVSVPMFFSSSNSYAVDVFNPYSFNSSVPVNISVQGFNSPIKYGLSLNNSRKSIVIENNTVISSGYNFNSSYSFSPLSSSTFNFSSFGTGGTLWSNFTLSSFSEKKLLNPLNDDLKINFSYKFAETIIPDSNLNYVFHVDVKFSNNQSQVSFPFPSIIRIFLLYSPNYSNYDLHSIASNPLFSYYLNGYSNINIIPPNRSDSSWNNVSLSIGKIISQITSDLGSNSILPYFNSFQGVEIGFFSYNSSNPRGATLLLDDFSLYHDIQPSNWFSLSGTAHTIPNATILLNNSLFQDAYSLNNCDSIYFEFNKNSAIIFDSDLLFNSNFILFSLNISHISFIFFDAHLLNEQFLLWSSQVTDFINYQMFSGTTRIQPVITFQSLVWFINKFWTPVQLPTSSNAEIKDLGLDNFQSFSHDLNENIWLGGPLNSSISNFLVSFKSSNLFSSFNIQSKFVKSHLSLKFTNSNEYTLTSNFQLFLNQNSILTLQRNFSNYEKTEDGFIFTFFLEDVSDKIIELNFFIFVSSLNLKLGFIIQKFNILLSKVDYKTSFNCKNAEILSPVITDTLHDYSLRCSYKNFDSDFNFLKNLFIFFDFLNQTQIYQFTNVQENQSSISFLGDIFLGSNFPSSNNSFLFNISVIDVSSIKSNVLWKNSSYFTIKQLEIISPSKIDIFSSWIFYAFFSSVGALVIFIGKKKSSNIIKGQIK
jgi:hypothetical protein